MANMLHHKATHSARRAALRVPNLQIVALYRLEEQRITLRGTIRDLSATGALLVTSKPLLLQQTILLQFKLADGPRVQTLARVMRSQGTDDGQHAAGVMFDFSTNQELALTQWVLATAAAQASTGQQT